MSGDYTSDKIPYNDYDDYSKGREALQMFHNSMLRFHGNKYFISFNELLMGLTKRSGQKFFIEGLGLGIIEADMSLNQVNEAMTQFAKSSGGKIPASNGAFRNALIGVASIGTWLDMGTFVASETAKSALQKTAVLGEKILDTGENLVDSATSIASSLKWMIPVILIGGAFIYVFNSSKR